MGWGKEGWGQGRRDAGWDKEGCGIQDGIRRDVGCSEEECR